MPSSKFNQRPTPRRRPAICIAPAGSCLQPYELFFPEKAFGFVTAVDVPPPVAYNWHACFNTQKMATPPSYYQIRFWDEGRLEVLIQEQFPLPLWNLTLSITLEGQPPGTIEWTNIFIDPSKAFDTGLLTRIIVPGINYYRARFTA